MRGVFERGARGVVGDGEKGSILHFALDSSPPPQPHFRASEARAQNGTPGVQAVLITKECNIVSHEQNKANSKESANKKC